MHRRGIRQSSSPSPSVCGPQVAVVVAGEVGDKGEALAIAALQGMQY